jgi:hypothetical protein
LTRLARIARWFISLFARIKLFRGFHKAITEAKKLPL